MRACFVFSHFSTYIQVHRPYPSSYDDVSIFCPIAIGKRNASLCLLLRQSTSLLLCSWVLTGPPPQVMEACNHAQSWSTSEHSMRCTCPMLVGHLGVNHLVPESLPQCLGTSGTHACPGTKVADGMAHTTEPACVPPASRYGLLREAVSHVSGDTGSQARLLLPSSEPLT